MEQLTVTDRICVGVCGSGVICSQVVYCAGYCWSPHARNNALDRKEVAYLASLHTVGQKLGAESADAG